METKTDWKVSDTSAVQVGVVTFDGKEFAALGACIDLDAGRAICYPDGETVGNHCAGDDWGGAVLFMLRCTGWSLTGFRDCTGRKTKLYSYRTIHPVGGFHWFGRGLGKGCLLRLRKGRKG